MRSVSVRLDDLKTMILNIGFVGENEHKRFFFDCKKMFDQYPHAAASMTVQPPEGEAYPAIIERDGDYVIWDVTDSDLAHDGDGELQLAFTQEPHIAKSYIGRTRVCQALVPSGDIPEGIDDFLTRAGAALTAIPQTIDDALAAAKASGEFDGADGQDGQDGADGFSPTVAVTEITGGHQVAVTDAEGTTTFDVMDGVDGQDGSDGAPGADGFSPRATVSKSGKVATITITDAAGTTTAQISDGEDGQGTNIIDDEAGAGDTDKTFSADKLTADHNSLLNAISQDIHTKTNLYDATGNTSGGCLRADGTVRANNNYVYTDYMAVDPLVYKYTYDKLCVANNYAYTCFYNSSKELLADKSVCLYKTPNSAWNAEYEITVPAEAKYARFSLWVGEDTLGADAFKFYQILDRISINTQIENLREENPIYEKTAIFFGDSICAATTDTDGGWAGRIGDGNAMNYHNYGYNGATVTAIAGHHCIASDVVDAVSTYPAPDFVVLEGGTNDADNLDEAGIGTFTENDYSGSYDTTTFSGAFETMLYNAVQQWPHAQIGYISAHKMGNGNNRAMRRTYFLRAQELCKKWGVPFIDLWIESKLNRDLSAQYDSSMSGEQNIAAHKLYTDGQHLTPDGYALITPQIEWWMRGI